MPNNQSINVLEKVFKYISVIEKKRRARLFSLRSFKLLQKVSLKNHKFLFKLNIITVAPILKLGLFTIRKKVEFSPLFVSFKKRILKLAKFIIAGLSKFETVNSYYNIQSSFIHLTKTVGLPLKKLEDSKQNKALRFKKNFRFKWFY